jgi:hypothetical protein
MSPVRACSARRASVLKHLRLPRTAVEHVSHTLPALAHPARWGTLLLSRLVAGAEGRQVIRGRMPIRTDCAPASNYAQSPHKTSFVSHDSTSDSHPKAFFVSLAADVWAGLALDLRVVPGVLPDFSECDAPRVALEELDLRARGHRSAGVCTELAMCEGQAVRFVLRVPPPRDAAAQDAAVPTEVHARELGIPFEQLVRAKSHMRAEDGPILTAVRPVYTFPSGHRSPSSFRRPSLATFTECVKSFCSCTPTHVAMQRSRALSTGSPSAKSP